MEFFTAGDTASRELITGGISGGGSHNGAWAISSGSWAGAAAARFSATRGGSWSRAVLEPAGGAGVRPRARPGTGTHPDDVVALFNDGTETSGDLAPKPPTHPVMTRN